MTEFLTFMKTAYNILGCPTTPWEIAGFLTGVLCVALIIKQNIWNWPVGILQVICYAILFYQIRLYADMGLQIFYIVTGLIGWWMWKYGGEKHAELKVSTLSWKWRIRLAILFIPAWVGMGWFLKTYTNASLPFWDSLASTLSVFAQILLMKKIFENWFLWLGVNVLSVCIYIYKHVYLTAGLYVVFMVLATMGLITWWKWLKEHRVTQQLNAIYSDERNQPSKEYMHRLTKKQFEAVQ